MKYLLIVSLLFNTLFCDDDYEREEHHHYYSKDLTHLDLSDIQKKTIKRVLKQYRRGLKEYRDFKEDIFDEKEELFEKDIFKKQSFESLNLKLATKASNIEIKFLETIHKILSKEQRELFIKHLDEWEIE